MSKAMKHTLAVLTALLLAPLATPHVSAATPAAQANGPAAEEKKLKLQEEYYRLIKTHPDAARKSRNEYMSLVNQSPANAPCFSYVLGAQWPTTLPPEQAQAPFLKGKSPQLEACKFMTELGSDILKIAPGTKELKDEGFDAAGYKTLDKVIRHPHYKQILDLPYRMMLFWRHGGGDGLHFKPMNSQQKVSLHKEFFEFTRYLLTQYNDTGKTFLIGNWEGDWMAGGKGVGDKNDLEEARISAFQEWLDVRTTAIDEAKAMTPHRNVSVYSYLEINHVDRAAPKD